MDTATLAVQDTVAQRVAHAWSRGILYALRRRFPVSMLAARPTAVEEGAPIRMAVDLLVEGTDDSVFRSARELFAPLGWNVSVAPRPSGAADRPSVQMRRMDTPVEINLRAVARRTSPVRWGGTIERKGTVMLTPGMVRTVRMAHWRA